ncbi:hypothetical protein B9Z55_026885 [Caenorhabditis nigoni]|uniref:Lin-15A/B-like domain-containing protein n=1 Tax=Caenorhabditis nigoni TaxID=1611254 RepID=A0A2G5SIF6_9PELO|nr:hypothetical protein B9Z55_026885 [Caenorhabditis nigoni]
MNEAIVKEEVIEETCNFTFKNGEYVEGKQEEIEQKPQTLLEKEIKTESIDSFENNDSKPFFEELEPKKESDFKIEKVRNRYSMNGVKRQNCQVCYMTKTRTELYDINSSSTRIVIMVGCILRGTNSVEQAKSR